MYVCIHHAPAVKPLWVSSGSRPPEKKELHRFRGSSPSGGKKRSIGLGVVPLPWEPSKKPERRRTKKQKQKTETNQKRINSHSKNIRKTIIKKRGGRLMAPRPRRRPLSRLGRAQSCPDARRRAEGALRGNSETSFFFKKKGRGKKNKKQKKEKKRGAGGKQHLCFLFFFLLFFPFAFPFFCFSFFSFHFSFCEPLFLNSASPFF